MDVTLPGVLVPMEYARDGQIVLNIAPVRWVILNWRTTKCVLTRVSAAYHVRFPLAAVLAIYARENGAGTMFEPEAAYDEDVASLNEDDATGERDSDTVMSVIDGDKPDHRMKTILMTIRHHAAGVRLSEW